MKEKNVDLEIEIQTAQELEKEGNLKFMPYGGISNYIAVYEDMHYVLRTDNDKEYYELLNPGKYL